MQHLPVGSIEKRCCCGGQVVLEDNEIGPLYTADYHTTQYRVACTKFGCGIKTGFYPETKQALEAWENKGWVNRRRAA